MRWASLSLVAIGMAVLWLGPALADQLDGRPPFSLSALQLALFGLACATAGFGACAIMFAPGPKP